MRNFLRKHIIPITAGILVLILGPAIADAINVTVPAAPGAAYSLTSTTTGQYVATSTITIGQLTSYVGVGSTTPGSLLSIGTNNGINFSTGTSTFSSTGGISIAAGCFAIGTTCVGAGGSGVTNIATTWPIVGGPITTTGTLTFGGLSTSTPAVLGAVPYFSGVNTFANIATTTSGVAGDLLSLNSIGHTVITYASSTAITASGTIYANNFFDTSTAGSSCIGDNSGILENGNCVASIASTLGSITYNSPTGAVSSDLNLAHANSWSVLQQFALSSSTRASVFTKFYAGGTATTTIDSAGNVSVAGTLTSTAGLNTFDNASSTNLSANQAAFGGTATSTFSTTGEQIGVDATNGYTGRVSPTGHFNTIAATSTATWTASSTAGVDASPPTPAPYAGTLKAVQCTSNSFLGVEILIGGSVVTPSYFIASATVGYEKFTANNTFTKGQLIQFIFGTTTTATASAPVYANCIPDTTETS